MANPSSSRREFIRILENHQALVADGGPYADLWQAFESLKQDEEFNDKLREYAETRTLDRVSLDNRIRKGTVPLGQLIVETVNPVACHYLHEPNPHLGKNVGGGARLWFNDDMKTIVKRIVHAAVQVPSYDLAGRARRFNMQPGEYLKNKECAVRIVFSDFTAEVKPV